jgi:hypothetical protein
VTVTSRNPGPEGSAHYGAALPEALYAALRRAHRAELTATGEHRRPAFRVTRTLLGGARQAGQPCTLLADCLGVSVASVRARAGSDGWLTTAEVVSVSGLSAQRIKECVALGWLPPPHLGAGGEELHLASHVVRAVIAESRTASHAAH